MCGGQQRQVMSADSALLSTILDKVAPFKVRPQWLWMCWIHISASTSYNMCL